MHCCSTLPSRGVPVSRDVEAAFTAKFCQQRQTRKSGKTAAGVRPGLCAHVYPPSFFRFSRSRMKDSLSGPVEIASVARMARALAEGAHARIGPGAYCGAGLRVDDMRPHCKPIILGPSKRGVMCRCLPNQVSIRTSNRAGRQ
jgi:hypothetical protein